MDAVLKDRNAITGAKLQDNIVGLGKKKTQDAFSYIQLLLCRQKCESEARMMIRRTVHRQCTVL